MSDVMSHALPGALPAISTLPETNLGDTLNVLFRVFLPTIAKGVIMRRPSMLWLADRLDLDARAVRVMQRVRAEYGAGPALVRLPGRTFALVLDPDDAHRVLAQSPEPFATETPEKRAALAHFEPKVSLISSGNQRADRGRYNDAVLEPDRARHELADPFLGIVEEESRELLTHVRMRGSVLDWKTFSDAWFRMVRRVVLGDAASSDDELSSMMAKLRYAANWAFLRPQRRGLRENLLARIRSYLHRAEPNSLAGMMAHIPATAATAPEQQVTQWLFAFDGAGMTTFRALALLAAHEEKARADDPPYLRATVMETLRLWPTTPLILRENTQATSWNRGSMPAHTGLVIFTPFFHRDNETLPFANRFAPEVWMNGDAERQGRALVPFSEGSGMCPGRQLVLLLTTAMLAEILRAGNVTLRKPQSRLRSDRPLPGTLDHFRIQFDIQAI